MSEPQPNGRRESKFWGGFFRQATEAIFLLDRRRRLRYVNPAWERLTGFTGEDVYGLSCVQRRTAPDREAEKRLALVLRPPSAVMAGQLQRVRRASPRTDTGAPWWDITFFPLMDSEGLLAIVGKVTPIGEARQAPRTEKISEPLMALRARIAQRYLPSLLESDVPAMRRVQAQVAAACGNASAVWIHGPTGSGKETVARIIHHQGSAGERAFAAVDASRLPSRVVSGMLLGQTGLTASARIGTLLIKYPEVLPNEIQREIITRLSESDARHPRVMVATSEPPTVLVETGQLGGDWLATLAVLEIALPPLAHRREDIPQLAMGMLDRLTEAGTVSGGLSAEALELLSGYEWPKNFWDLRTILADALGAADGKRLDVEHFPRWLREAGRPELAPTPTPSFLNLALVLEQVERRMITLALKQAGGNQTEAAERLGIWRARLARRIEALKIEIPGKKPVEPPQE